MVRFAEVFPDEKIVNALRSQLGWTHFRSLLAIEDPLKREFYAEMRRIEGWSTRTLAKRIDGMLFERTALSKKPDSLIQHELIAPPALAEPERFQDVLALEVVVTEVLKRYMDSYYRLEQRRWDSRHLEYRKLTLRESNFENYKVRIPASEKDLAAMVKVLIKDRHKRFCEAVRELPNLYFDRHIYQPLLLEPIDQVTTTPAGLNAGEKRLFEIQESVAS